MSDDTASVASSTTRRARTFSRTRVTRVTASPSPAPRQGRTSERDAAAPRTAAERSASRGSFLGRSRTPVGVGNSAHARWRSGSPTLRGTDESVERPPRDASSDSRASASTKYGKARRSLSRVPGLRRVLDGDEGSESGKPAGKHGGGAGGGAGGSSAALEEARGSDDAEQKPLLPYVARLPRGIHSFFGYRREGAKPLLPGVLLLHPTVEAWIWAWIGAAVPLGAIAALFSHAYPFAASVPNPTVWASPVIVGSFGASSILLFGAPASPLGQPWAFAGGQVVSALAGVCVTKLFALNSHYNIADPDSDGSLVWVAGAISTATALVAMFATNTVHPPGGATALLAATSTPIVQLGWHYIVVVMISSAIMVVWACFWMNLGRARYPHHWVAPDTPARQHSVFGIFDAWRRQQRKRRERRAEAEKKARGAPDDGPWSDESAPESAPPEKPLQHGAQ